MEELGQGLVSDGCDDGAGLGRWSQVQHRAARTRPLGTKGRVGDLAFSDGEILSGDMSGPDFH